MHNLLPDRPYKIVTLQIAAPAEFGDAEITDGLNEILREAQMPGEESVVADYRFVTTPRLLQTRDTEFEVQSVGHEPEEGEVFHQVMWP